MFRSIEGVYRDGKIELSESPEGLDEVPVIVTFLTTPKALDLRELGIDESQAADLRARFSTFIEDWDRPEMNDYDAL